MPQRTVVLVLNTRTAKLEACIQLDALCATWDSYRPLACTWLMDNSAQVRACWLLFQAGFACKCHMHGCWQLPGRPQVSGSYLSHLM